MLRFLEYEVAPLSEAEFSFQPAALHVEIAVEAIHKNFPGLIQTFAVAQLNKVTYDFELAITTRVPWRAGRSTRMSRTASGPPGPCTPLKASIWHIFVS